MMRSKPSCGEVRDRDDRRCHTPRKLFRSKFNGVPSVTARNQKLRLELQPEVIAKLLLSELVRAK